MGENQKLGGSMQCEEGTDWLLELLLEVQLQQYFLRIRDDLNVTRLSHFDYVKNEDLEKIGMGRPDACRSLDTFFTRGPRVQEPVTFEPDPAVSSDGLRVDQVPR
ncbi:hypothetical protein fugu_014253 [Takifugu bimaculatus]|uniref:non-specific protein-tyrosine kinase n=1 Tax=Takifugu bimaculatus TaxID=433685 RepID=A0A4Z2C1K6_9TELE|nr:hypothetical protein fugu_014253 [Takifugu bimaculatus]